MKLTRRIFIMASGISAGSLVTGCAMLPAAPLHSALMPRKAKPSSAAAGDWVASTCQGCTQWCAIQIFVQAGRATRVRGNPLSKTNHGYCCPRGHMIPQQMYDPDRIKVPMKRTNPLKGRGIDPKFVPISWDEALNTVADRMIELRKAKETHKLVYMRGRYSSTSTELLYGTLPKIFGTGNYFSHSAICAEAEKMGPGLTQGFFGYRDYDLTNTNCLVLWGTDPLASNRMVPNMMNQFPAIVQRGTVIAVDPRLSNVAAKAHEKRQAHQHTHAAFGIGILHGLAGSSHLIGILPILAFPTRTQALAYLLAFGAGTIMSMAAFSTGIGWLARRCNASGLNVYRGLMSTCGVAAMAVGCFWLATSFR